MKIKYFFPFILILLIVPKIYAQFDNVGTSAVNFLKIGVGSRATAMGDAFVAQANDATALYWNVAGLTEVEKREVHLSLTDWILDIRLLFAGAAVPLKNWGTLGVSIYSLSMGEIEETTAEKPDGTGITFTSSDITIGVAYARKFTDRFSAGIQAKYIYEKIAFSSGQAFAVDFGSLYTTNFRNMRIGMSISNFGTNMRLDGRDVLEKVDPFPTVGSNPENVLAKLSTEEWPLPLIFRIGISMNLFQSDFMNLTGNFSYQDPRDLNPLYNTGFELSFRNILFLRAGNRISLDKHQQQDAFDRDYLLTAGGGLQINMIGYKLNLDYAYADLGRLTNTHRFSFSFKF